MRGFPASRFGRPRGDRILTETDVVVVGGRIAGSIAAARLVDAGVRVVIVDRARFPSATLSTHFFRGAGLVGVLSSLGVLEEVLALGAPPLTRQWSYSNGSAEPIEQPPQDPGDIGYCLSVRREPLDQILLDRSGATVVRGRVTDVLLENGVVAGVRLDSGDEIRSRFVIGADGRHSAIASLVHAPSIESERGHRAIYYRYVSDWKSPHGGPSDGPEFSLLDDEMAYAFPSDAGLTCLAVSVNREVYKKLRRDVERTFDERLSRHAAFAGRGTKTNGVVGCGPETNLIRECWGSGWALVGDAGQHQDPWTGIGMDLAGRGATALATEVKAWLDGDEDAGSRYVAARDAMGRDMWRFTVASSRDLSAMGG